MNLFSSFCLIRENSDSLMNAPWGFPQSPSCGPLHLVMWWQVKSFSGRKGFSAFMESSNWIRLLWIFSQLHDHEADANGLILETKMSIAGSKIFRNFVYLPTYSEYRDWKKQKDYWTWQKTVLRESGAQGHAASVS